MLQKSLSKFGQVAKLKAEINAEGNWPGIYYLYSRPPTKNHNNPQPVRLLVSRTHPLFGPFLSMCIPAFSSLTWLNLLNDFCSIPS